MISQKILVVEDEAIVASNISKTLRRMGYTVPRPVGSGEEAIQQAAAALPDLVLMDIHLDGLVDGIEAAAQIRTRFGIPVIYLTAYADDATLMKARETQPAGYLVKPFKTEDLRSTIEMALYKHEMERRLKESEERYRMVSELVSDFAYSARVQPDGQIVLEWATAALERFAGLAAEELLPHGRWRDHIYPDDLSTMLDHVQTCLAGQANVAEFRLVARNGQVRWMREYLCPVWDETQGRTVRLYGAVQDVTERRQAEEEQKRLILELKQALANVKTLRGLLPICASCKKIRDDKGYWTQVEVYLREHSEAVFSHGICPDCMVKLYPGFVQSEE
jgi:PAS domain S-box-containing protein